MSRKTPSVVLAGRPNVGKSTLFNRITGTRRAIVAPMAGTTRDSLARPVVWRGTSFQVLDTGGLFGASEDPLHELVVVQGQRAIAGADLIVLVVDGRDGLLPGDEQIARELRGFGVFQVKPRKRGIGRNPRTGKEVRIPPGRTIRFKPGKDLQNIG